MTVIPHSESQSKHLIVHGKLNFSVPSPPPYKRKVWDYEKANYRKICEEISLIDWESNFCSKSIDEMEVFFSERFLSIISRNIPNKIITCNDKDAPWITNEVKSAIRRNHRVYQKWVLRGRLPNNKDYVRTVQRDTNKIIRKAKAVYIKSLGDKINDSCTGSKTFWSSFKRLVNKKNLPIFRPCMKMARLFLIFIRKLISSMIFLPVSVL